MNTFIIGSAWLFAAACCSDDAVAARAIALNRNTRTHTNTRRDLLRAPGPEEGKKFQAVKLREDEASFP